MSSFDINEFVNKVKEGFGDLVNQVKSKMEGAGKDSEKKEEKPAKAAKKTEKSKEDK